jgi:DNA-3-methyladenine glycosylase I
VYDDLRLFEFLVLDAFQAGLSWLTVPENVKHLERPSYDFDPVQLVNFDEKKLKP